ncbi:unnamed protein product [Clavelina lepadiformis]|uniref:Uncharacterized protein n=1 Tax=Clavelina lepadiformis TaxID=159417 RepID=A0ABP0GXC7_CLALP
MTKLGLKMFNLKRHIERHHPDIFKTVLEEKQPKNKEDIQDNSTSKQQMLWVKSETCCFTDQQNSPGCDSCKNSENRCNFKEKNQ